MTSYSSQVLHWHSVHRHELPQHLYECVKAIQADGSDCEEAIVVLRRRALKALSGMSPYAEAHEFAAIALFLANEDGVSSSSYPTAATLLRRMVAMNECGFEFERRTEEQARHLLEDVVDDVLLAFDGSRLSLAALELTRANLELGRRAQLVRDEPLVTRLLLDAAKSNHEWSIVTLIATYRTFAARFASPRTDDVVYLIDAGRPSRAGEDRVAVGQFMSRVLEGAGWRELVEPVVRTRHSSLIDLFERLAPADVSIDLEVHGSGNALPRRGLRKFTLLEGGALKQRLTTYPAETMDLIAPAALEPAAAAGVEEHSIPPALR